MIIFLRPYYYVHDLEWDNVIKLCLAFLFDSLFVVCIYCVKMMMKCENIFLNMPEIAGR